MNGKQIIKHRRSWGFPGKTSFGCLCRLNWITKFLVELQWFPTSRDLKYRHTILFQFACVGSSSRTYCDRKEFHSLHYPTLKISFNVLPPTTTEKNIRNKSAEKRGVRRRGKQPREFFLYPHKFDVNYKLWQSNTI